jgi:fatty acid desaturase
VVLKKENGMTIKKKYLEKMTSRELKKELRKASRHDLIAILAIFIILGAFFFALMGWAIALTLVLNKDDVAATIIGTAWCVVVLILVVLSMSREN